MHLVQREKDSGTGEKALSTPAKTEDCTAQKKQKVDHVPSGITSDARMNNLNESSSGSTNVFKETSSGEEKKPVDPPAIHKFEPRHLPRSESQLPTLL